MLTMEDDKNGGQLREQVDSLYGMASENFRLLCRIQKSLFPVGEPVPEAAEYDGCACLMDKLKIINNLVGNINIKLSSLCYDIGTVDPVPARE